MSTTEKNKELFRRYANEIMTKGKYEAAEEIFTRDYVEHDPFNPPNQSKGPVLVKELAQFYRNAFPDARMTVDEIIATDDRVIARWTAEGTHKGDLMGIRPTNKRVTVTGITFNRIRDGKIIEAWTNWDSFGMLTQLGVREPLGKPKKAA